MRLLALVLACAAQAAPATFDVASIKPHDPANPRTMMADRKSTRLNSSHL